MKKRGILGLGILLIGLCIFFGNVQKFGCQDDYYEVVNYEVFASNHIEDGKYTWSRFTEAQDEVDEDVDEIVEDIVKGNTNELNEEDRIMIQKLYYKAMDMETRNQVGMQDLQPYLDRIWNVSRVEELVDMALIIENELGVDILTNVVIAPDYQDHSRNIVYFYPVTYVFGANSDYMIHPDYMTYKAYLKRACVQIWKVYGYEDGKAREVVDEIFSFYEQVSQHSKLTSSLSSIEDYYQVVSREEALNVYGVLGEKYFGRKGIGDRDVYSLVDKGQFQYLNASLTMENLLLWKEIMIMKILASYVSYGSDEYMDIVRSLNQSLLGVENEKTRKEEASDMIQELFSSEIDKIYEKRVLTLDKEESIQDMVLEIKKAYRKMLDNNDWLDEKTIKRAKQKLEKMNIVIGLESDEIERSILSKLYIGEESFLLDVIKIRELKWKMALEDLKSGNTEIEVPQTMVNAYYQPLTNSIVIPASFFQLIDEKRDYYEKLGSLGMILAHEITHGFDGNGSLFDEDGVLNSWWTDSDWNNFNDLKKEVSDYYQKYEVMPGYYINGEGTVNENIADLGALNCIVEVAKEKGATKNDYQKMFRTFASIWASQEKEDYMKLLLLQDVHAPNKYRVNAVLSSIDMFYQVYGVRSWDKMYLDKKDRVQVW